MPIQATPASDGPIQTPLPRMTNRVMMRSAVIVRSMIASSYSMWAGSPSGDTSRRSCRTAGGSGPSERPKVEQAGADGHAELRESTAGVASRPVEISTNSYDCMTRRMEYQASAPP